MLPNNLKTLQKIFSHIFEIAEDDTEKITQIDHEKWYSRIGFAVLRDDFLALKAQRRGNILYDSGNELKRAVIDSIK